MPCLATPPAARHTQVRVFQSTRCSLTEQTLELPVVHFMCGHSFNVRSLGDNDKECPLCAPDNRCACG